MKEAELLLVDGRGQVAEALQKMQVDCPFTLHSAYARSSGGGAQVIWREYSNVSTSISVVDELTYQVTVRGEKLDDLTELAAGVNRAMLELGFRRSYASEDGYDSGGAGAYTKTYRFSRKVDKRTMRLIDG